MLPEIVGMSHRFVVTVGMFVLGSWSKVSGLAVKWDLAEYRVGNSDEYFKFAGVPRFERLKLSRFPIRSLRLTVRSRLNRNDPRFMLLPITTPSFCNRLPDT